MSPALVASVTLHLGVAALAFISWREAAKEVTISPVVPVTIINGAAADVRETVEAETPAPAQSEAIQPAPPEPPPPEPAPAPAPTPAPPPPKPAPPRPQPKPQPTPPPKPQPRPAPARPTPAPRQPTPAPAAKPRPEQRLDLDALAASLAGQRSPRAPKPAPAPVRGPARPAQGPQTQKGAGVSDRLSGGEMAMLQAKLERLWNPNCEVSGASTVIVKIRMRLRPDGGLSAPPTLVSRSGEADDRVLAAAADRALSAAGFGAPYDELPADRYEVWKDIVFTFRAKSACSR
jgi:periplasmic protein TonB